MLLDKISQKNGQFENFTRESTQTKKSLRDEMAELENRLRKLRDRKCELEVSNRNLEIIVDTENQLRSQKDNAEA